MMVIHSVTAGWSDEPNQWKGTYEHSHTFFEAAVQNLWEMTGNARPRIRVQTNLHADLNFRRHINTFDWAEANQERKEWVKALRPGDRLQLYAIARFPGWLNFVQKVKITIHYYEKADKDDNRDKSAEELLENSKKPRRNLERNSGEGFISHRPKVVIYHQSLYSESGILTSIRPLAREKTGITAIILGKFQLHFNHSKIESPTHQSRDVSCAALHLNGYKIDDPSIEDVWVDIEYLQHENIKALGMLDMRGKYNMWRGLAFEHSYKLLHELVVLRRLDGIDLDLDLPETRKDMAKEIGVSLKDIIRLIDSLYADFGSDFIITMTTSAEALLKSDINQQDNGFQYQSLELQRGELISWYNVRIFSVSSNRDDDQIRTSASAPIFVDELNSFIRLLNHDFYSAHKIIMAVSTGPNSNAVGETSRGDDQGVYVEPSYLFHSLLELLSWSYGPFDFGGVAGWEYSRSRPPSNSVARDKRGYDRPWDWAKLMKAVLDNVFPEE